MKRIIMFFIFSSSLYPLMAQTTDSSHVNSASNSTMMTNSSDTSTTHAMNGSSNMGNMNSGTDTAHAMNGSSSMGSMNSNVDNNSSMMNSMKSGDPAALPVLENSIPDAVVAKAKEKFGVTLYDITCAKHTADQNAYVVRTQTNGTYATQWIDDSGNTMQ